MAGTVRLALNIRNTMVGAGAAIAGVWLYFAWGDGFVHWLRGVDPSAILGLAGLLVVWHLVRFIRWQFMLRRVGVRVPLRSSLSVYLASLAGMATPGYVGESARAYFLHKRFGAPVRAVLGAWVAERALDFAALAVLLAASVAPPWIGAGALVALVLALVLVSLVWQVRDWWAASGSDGLLRSLPAAMLLSIVMWMPAAVIFLVAAQGLEVMLGLSEGVRVYTASTILGGLTLMPLGLGATGTFAILQLEELGLTLGASVSVVSLSRAFTTWLSAGLGVAFLIREVRVAGVEPEQGHFDQIATEYSRQFKEHIWNHLIGRKMRLIEGALPPAFRDGIGLDVGCGLGLQVLRLEEQGFSVAGIDTAHNLLQQAAANGVVCATADALRLPFHDEAFDFVYTVGVMHHLPDRDAQARATAEVARTLKPGGHFIVHETNPRNPLFRFYMGYVFPMVRSIDEGTEWWIDPHWWEDLPSLRLKDAYFFTFLPDFVPRWLMPLLTRLERWLERSRFGSYSVHYMVVLERLPDQARAAAESGLGPPQENLGELEMVES
jgi:SAM-dependent methyltransferase/uncharacterized membrane protein YbhN (UPF0104 family)